MPEIASAFRDHSIASMSGASETVFEETSFSGIQERFIYNPNATGSVWINLFGGVAAANAAGSMELPPGTGWSGKATNEINAIGTASAKLTAGER